MLCCFFVLPGLVLVGLLRWIIGFAGWLRLVLVGLLSDASSAAISVGAVGTMFWIRWLLVLIFAGYFRLHCWYDVWIMWLLVLIFAG